MNFSWHIPCLRYNLFLVVKTVDMSDLSRASWACFCAVTQWQNNVKLLSVATLITRKNTEFCSLISLLSPVNNRMDETQVLGE